MVLRRLERAHEVVEHRQELHDDALARTRVELVLLAGDALAVVVEVRRDAAEVVEHLVALPLRVLQPREQLLAVARRVAAMGCGVDRGRRVELAVPLGRRDDVGTILGHDVFAASSSSITS